MPHQDIGNDYYRQIFFSLLYVICHAFFGKIVEGFPIAFSSLEFKSFPSRLVATKDMRSQSTLPFNSFKFHAFPKIICAKVNYRLAQNLSSTHQISFSMLHYPHFISSNNSKNSYYIHCQSGHVTNNMQICDEILFKRNIFKLF